MTSLRMLAAEIAAQRLVAKGHLTSRSLNYFPRFQLGIDGPVPSSGPHGAVSNPFLGSVETAAGSRGDARPRRVGHPPAPCPAAIPPE